MKHLISTAVLFLTIAIATTLAVAARAQAAEVPHAVSHAATANEASLATQQNLRSQESREFNLGAPANFQPVADTAQFAYVLMSANTQGEQEVEALRETIARHLPDGVKLVILTNSQNAADVKAQYAQWISPDRLIIAVSNDPDVDNGFWARDSFPVPVVAPQAQVSLVAAHYFRNFDSAAAIDQSVGSPALTRPAITFVGGDLIADANGVCFSVEGSREFGLTPAQIQSTYGCKQLHIMKHVAGLGDVDEVLKPLSPTLMLTNRSEYQAQLQSWGYKVVMLPDLPGYRTYANSLIVDKTVFMPAYGVAQDAQAEAVYQQLGYTVYPIRSLFMSDDLWGSVHCQTMAYPAMPQAQLMTLLRAHVQTAHESRSVDFQ